MNNNDQMDSLQRRVTLKSFYISIGYVGIGTVALFSMSPGSPLYFDWIVLINILTMPVCFLGFGILYGGGNESLLIALGAQIVVFFIFWFIINKTNHH